MVGINITIQGVENIVARLGKAVAAETLRAPMQRSVDRIQRAMQGYPPELPGQTYRRTGNLGRSWKTLVTTSQTTGLTGKVYEDARSPTGVHYGPFVQGEKTQAHVHRGRWLTDEGAIAQEAPAIEADFADSIKKALN